MIDRSRLRALLGGDELKVGQFLEIFRTQTPRQLGRLKGGAREKNWESVAIEAHGIKSQCRYLGLDAAAELAQRIEKYADDRQELPSILLLAGQLEEMLLALIGKELS